MDYIEMMKKNEPYISRFMDAPRDIKDKAKKLLKELNSLGDDEGERKNEILKNLFGTYHPLA